MSAYKEKDSWGLRLQLGVFFVVVSAGVIWGAIFLFNFFTQPNYPTDCLLRQEWTMWGPQCTRTADESKTEWDEYWRMRDALADDFFVDCLANDLYGELSADGQKRRCADAADQYAETLMSSDRDAILQRDSGRSVP